MLKLIKKIRLFFVLVLLIVNVKAGENLDNIKISGSVISDFYYIHSAETAVAANYKPKTQRQVYNERRSGFQFRRIYLSFDKKIDKEFSTRIRFEMSNTDYDYSKMHPTVKDAYLKWHYSDNHYAYFGISGSPAIGPIEKFWGYRLLEKSASDYFGIRSSRDFGVALKGKILRRINYHLFLGNGESNASEKSGTEDKLYSLSLHQQVAKNFYYQLYTDYRWAKDNNENEFTGQVFGGYKNKKFRIGLQYTYQDNKLMKTKKRGKIHLISLPFVYNYADKLSLIFRYIRYSAKEEQNYVEQSMIYGFEYKIRANVFIMPNITYTDYDFESNDNLGKDIISKITLAYKFN